MSQPRPAAQQSQRPPFCRKVSPVAAVSENHNLCVILHNAGAKKQNDRKNSKYDIILVIQHAQKMERKRRLHSAPAAEAKRKGKAPKQQELSPAGFGKQSPPPAGHIP